MIGLWFWLDNPDQNFIDFVKMWLSPSGLAEDYTGSVGYGRRRLWMKR